MDFKKSYEREKRLNSSLRKDLAKLELENNELVEKCLEPDVEVTELIAVLKGIKKEWSETLADLQKQRDEYKKLITEMRAFRNNIIGSTRLQRMINKKLG